MALYGGFGRLDHQPLLADVRLSARWSKYRYSTLPLAAPKGGISAHALPQPRAGLVHGDGQGEHGDDDGERLGVMEQ